MSFTLIIQLANAAPRRANTGRIKGTIIEKGTSEVASIKVRSAVILEMLKQLRLGTAHSDLTKISKPVPKYGAEIPRRNTRLPRRNG